MTVTDRANTSPIWSTPWRYDVAMKTPIAFLLALPLGPPSAAHAQQGDTEAQA